MKGAALIRLTFDPDLPVHQLHQLARYCQTQSGAAIVAGSRGIRLSEWAKDPLLVFRRDADSGIGNGERQSSDLGRLLLKFGPDDNFALMSEFDGIVHQIHQNLPETQRIPDQQVRAHGRANRKSMPVPFLWLERAAF